MPYHFSGDEIEMSTTGGSPQPIRYENRQSNSFVTIVIFVVWTL
jgi:hypothetical protein